MFLLDRVPNKKKSITGLFSIFIIVVFFLLFSIYANVDLRDGRYAIFMDEQIIFDGVENILHSSNINELISNVVNGDHRYGRILYYVSAYFSYIPEKFFGEQGLIVATRFVQTVSLISAYLILSFSLFKQWAIRVISLLLLLLMPTTLYYFTMPKPEPLQTLFIALFLWGACKQSFKFGWYWLFIGLAFGAKISVLPYVLMFGLLALYQHNTEILSVSFWRYTITKTICLFLTGFLIAEPILLTGNLQIYLNSTFRNTTHGADDNTITVLSWAEFIFNTLPSIFLFILALGFVFMIVAFLYKAVSFVKDGSFRVGRFSSYLPVRQEYICFYILLFGFLMLLLITLRVDRLWYFYLHLPLIFIIIGTLMALESFVLSNKTLVRFFPIGIIIGLGLYCSVYVLVISPKYIEMSKRTETNVYKTKNIEYNYIKSFLQTLAYKENKHLKVAFDPNLFLLKSTDKYQIERFWGWFIGWKYNYDVVVFYPMHNGVEMKQNLSKTNITFQKFILSKELYDKFINKEKKYIRLTSEDIPKDLRIFLKSDIAKKYKSTNMESN